MPVRQIISVCIYEEVFVGVFCSKEVLGCSVRLASVKMSVEDRQLAARRPPSPLLTVKSLDISSILLNSPTAMDPLDSPWGGMHIFFSTHCPL